MRRPLLLAPVLLCCVAARADVTYTYVGQPFTTTPAPYTSSDRVTGYFTLAQDLDKSPNSGYYEFFPIAFSFSDGVQTITEQNAAQSFFGFADFNADGTFADLEIEVAAATMPDPYRPYPITTGIEIGIYDSGRGGGDSADYMYGPDAFSLGPGTITETSATPEPASFALLAAGFVCLVATSRRSRT